MAIASSQGFERSEHLEQEVKLEAGVTFALPDLRDVVPGGIVRNLPEQRLHSVYLDTADLRLARSGVTLRHRREQQPGGTEPGLAGADPTGVWTLKLPSSLPHPGGETSVMRREITVAGKWGPVPQQLDSLVRAFRRTAGLQPVARLVTQRRRSLLCGARGDALLEIDDDVVSVMAGRRLAARFREVEVEVVGVVPSDLLSSVVSRVEGAGAHAAADQRPKLVRALGPRAQSPPDVVPVSLGPSSTLGEVARAAVAAGYLRIVAHDPDVRSTDDAEAVHQARVGTRRLRSDLRTFRFLFPDDWYEVTTGELRWIGDALGRVRDADVMLERLEDAATSLDAPDSRRALLLLERLVTQRDSARSELLVAMDSERYVCLLDRIADAARSLPVKETVPTSDTAERETAGGGVQAEVGGRINDVPSLVDVTDDEDLIEGDDSAAADVDGPTIAFSGPSSGASQTPSPGPDTPAAKAAPEVAARPWKHLARAIGALGPEPAEESLHGVRIFAKRLRYACEALEGVAGKPAARTAALAADLQGVLGDLHDASVAESWVRAAVAGGGAEDGVAAGLLIASQRQEAAARKAQWRKSWDQLDRKRVRSWMDA